MWVRSAMSAPSNSAMPANTVKTILPAGEVVSAHGSASDRKPAPARLRRSARSSRSRVGWTPPPGDGSFDRADPQELAVSGFSEAMSMTNRYFTSLRNIRS
jgi:hypothetical protein